MRISDTELAKTDYSGVGEVDCELYINRNIDRSMTTDRRVEKRVRSSHQQRFRIMFHIKCRTTFYPFSMELRNDPCVVFVTENAVRGYEPVVKGRIVRRRRAQDGKFISSDKVFGFVVENLIQGNYTFSMDNYEVFMLINGIYKDETC